MTMLLVIFARVATIATRFLITSRIGSKVIFPSQRVLTHKINLICSLSGLIIPLFRNYSPFRFVNSDFDAFSRDATLIFWIPKTLTIKPSFGKMRHISLKFSVHCSINCPIWLRLTRFLYWDLALSLTRIWVHALHSATDSLNTTQRDFQ